MVAGEMIAAQQGGNGGKDYCVSEHVSTWTGVIVCGMGHGEEEKHGSVAAWTLDRPAVGKSTRSSV